jgi:hypothetical protein
MRAAALLLLVAALGACKSGGGSDDSKYVCIQCGSRGPVYARREETEKVDELGMIEVENLLTKRRVRLKSADCIIRGVSRSEVLRAQGNHFVYDQ